jgi:hypothetical protein
LEVEQGWVFSLDADHLEKGLFLISLRAGGELLATAKLMVGR